LSIGKIKIFENILQNEKKYAYSRIKIKNIIIIGEKGFTVDEDEFKTLMNEQKVRARENRKAGGGWSKDGVDIFENVSETEFAGYTENEVEAKVLAISADGMLIDEIKDGEGIIVLDKTVFYGEGGGQVGDTGKISGENFEAEVVDTKKANGKYLHIVNIISGSIKTGDKVIASIDVEKREAIRRNHSTVHLLQAALRKVLGDHVEQAGSYVDAERFRFDFSHFEPMTKDQIKEVEALVNSFILAGAEVETVVTDIETARNMGAMALFGEKYGDTVRVVKMGEFSTELCGGTHMTNTAKAGLCKILYESSVAAGVRRIEGITGENVLSYIYENLGIMQETAKNLKAQNISDIADKSLAVTGEIKELKSKIEELSSEIAKSKTGDLMKNSKKVGDFTLVTARLDGMTGDELRAAGDVLKDSDENIVAVLGSVCDGKVTLLAVCGKTAVKCGAHAGKIIKEAAAKVGGGGGGRPDSAQAGGKDASKLDEALALVEELL